MKKRSKKIIGGLGAATISGTIAAAAVAQGCGNTDNLFDVTPQLIMAEINQLASYNEPEAGQPGPGGLAGEILSAIRMELTTQNPGVNFDISSLLFDPIILSDVSTEGQGTYIVRNLSIVGMGRDTTASPTLYNFTGSTNLTFVRTTSALNVSNVEGFTATAIDAATIILNATNELNGYERGVTELSSTAGSMVTSMTTFLTDLLPNSNSIVPTTLDFTEITSSAVERINAESFSSTFTLTSGTALQLGASAQTYNLTGTVVVVINIGNPAPQAESVSGLMGTPT